MFRTACLFRVPVIRGSAAARSSCDLRTIRMYTAEAAAGIASHAYHGSIGLFNAAPTPREGLIVLAM